MRKGKAVSVLGKIQETSFFAGISRGTILLSLSAGLYWSWWDSFHELYRFGVLGDATQGWISFLNGGSGYLQCIMKPVGIMMGCAVLLLALRGMGRSTSSSADAGIVCSLLNGERLGVVLFVAQMVAWIACCAAMGMQQRFAAAFAYGAASVFVVPSFVGLAVRLGRMDEVAVGWVIMSALGCYGVFNNLIYPLFLQDVPVAFVCVVYMVVLAVAFALACLSGPESCEERRGEGDCSSVLPPWRLALHVVVYGCVFGILHILEGVVQTGPQSVNIGVFFGCLIAMAVFYALFMRPGSGKEIWSKIRSTVFPFVIVGYLLLPLARDSDIALAFTEAGGLLYFAVLFFGCASLMRRTNVAPATIVAWALLLYSVGEGAGVSFMVALVPSFAVASDGYFVLAVIIVALLTVATFWVASDEQVRKLWGFGGRSSRSATTTCSRRFA